MKKLVLATGLAAAMATTAVAGEAKKIETDPFASTQNGAVIGAVVGLGALILIVAADKT